MKWYSKIFLDDKLKENVNFVKEDINKKFYYITLPSNESNMLDIFMGKHLKDMGKNKRYVIGIASSEINAYYLVADIVSEAYEQTGFFDLKEYYKDYD